MIDPFRMVDEWVAVVLPVVVDLIIPGNFSRVDWITGMPGAYVCFHPCVDVPLIIARAIAASPISVIGHREVEISSSQIAFKVVWSLEAFAHS